MTEPIISNHFFTRQDTKIAKGIAISLMIFHHLFAYGRNKLPIVTLIPTDSLPFFQWLSEFGNICVSIFLFLSGYGIFYTSGKIYKWSIAHFKNFFIKYWVIFFLFVPIGFFFFNKEFNLSEFLLNLFCINATYNREWWFARLYIEILLFAPLLVLVLKKNLRIGILFSFFLGGIGFFLRFLLGFQTGFWLELCQFLLWQMMFACGYLWSSLSLFARLQHILKKISFERWYHFLILLMLGFLIREGTPFPNKLLDPVLTPLMIYFFVCFFKKLHLNKLFVLLGEHATNLWLIHTFFCYYYTPELVYSPRFVPFIFIWLLLLSLGTSYMINAVQIFIVKGFYSCRRKH